MQKQSSELYQWWNSHQTREDMTMTPLVREQRNILKQWLNEMIHQKTATCPHCHKECQKPINDGVDPNRPQFMCNHCRKSINPLAKTPFCKMHFIDLWLPYIDLVTEGISHAEIEQQLGVSKRALTLWHKNLLKQIELMQLDALKQWMSWQKSRYQVEANSKNNKTK